MAASPGNSSWKPAACCVAFSDGGGELYAVSRRSRSAMEMHAEASCVGLSCHSSPASRAASKPTASCSGSATAPRAQSMHRAPMHRATTRQALTLRKTAAAGSLGSADPRRPGHHLLVRWCTRLAGRPEAPSTGMTTGELIGLLIDGPISGARAWTAGSGWNTAHGGAHMDAANGALSLWDRVVARAATASIYADRTTVDAEKVLQADGDLVVVTPHGLSFRRRLDELRRTRTALVESGHRLPKQRRSRSHRSAAHARGLRSVRRDPHAASCCAANLIGEEAWQFEGARLESHLDSSRAAGRVRARRRDWQRSARPTGKAML